VSPRPILTDAPERRASWSLLRGLCLPMAAVLACGAGRSAPSTPAPATPPSTTHAAPRIKRVPDANTAAILLTSHNVTLASARLAPSRARSRDVKLLALNLVTDHTALSRTLSALLTRLDISPREDEVTRLMRDQAAARRDTLRSLSGWPFDSAYVESEVRAQQDLLVAIDRVFIPSAHNPRLREYVETMRPTIAAHLTLAEQVRDAINASR
jgi:putative membrane protein